jgi:hypothetical protein
MLTKKQGEINERRIFKYWWRISLVGFLLFIGVSLLGLLSLKHYLPPSIHSWTRHPSASFVPTSLLILASAVYIVFA